jgi:hypothetical protein
MTEVTVKEVTTLRELRDFIDYPHRLYGDNQYWVPSLFLDDYYTLRKDKNPAFEHCEARYWIASRDNKPVGRIAAIINKNEVINGNQAALRFGWVDFEDDPVVSTALFEQVENWARQKQISTIHGPLGFTDLDREGMLIEGFEELGTLATIYNFPYYPEHLQRLGYNKDVDWVEYEMTVPKQVNPTIAKIADLAKRRLNLRLTYCTSRKQLFKLAPDIFKMLNEEYAHLFGYIPLTDRQIQHYVRQYFHFILLEFVPIVVDTNGQMVGFGIVMPSFSRALQRCKGKLLPFGFWHLYRALKSEIRIDLCLVAVRSSYQGKGVNAIIMDGINHTLVKRKILKVESNPELETNQDIQGQWRHYEPRQHKRRRCFIKSLDGQVH